MESASNAIIQRYKERRAGVGRMDKRKMWSATSRRKQLLDSLLLLSRQPGWELDVELDPEITPSLRALGE